MTRWPIRSSEAFEIESKVIGDRIAVGVCVPDPALLAIRGLKPEYTLVYVLDGAWALGIASGIAFLQLADLLRPGFPPLALVGLDYPEDRPNARTRDYTMADAVPEATRQLLRSGPEATPGGADNFLAFMEQELDPLIRSRFPIADRPAGILGDSFGGTFTFYAFLRQSRLFDRYWLGSPALLTTNTDHVAKIEPVVSRPLVHDTRLFLSLGELEANGGIEFYQDMGRNYHRLVDLLGRHPNDRLAFRSKIYPGHTHTSVLTPALSDALFYLYGPHIPE